MPAVEAPDCGTVPARVKRISTRGQAARPRSDTAPDTPRHSFRLLLVPATRLNQLQPLDCGLRKAITKRR